MAMGEKKKQAKIEESEKRFSFAKNGKVVKE